LSWDFLPVGPACRAGKVIVIWVSQGEDAENAGPVAADALEGVFDLGDPRDASRTGERAY
jgi:hypothetical protein